MKQFNGKQHIFLLLTLIFALAALFPLGRRISAEQKQRKVAVIMTLEEIKELSEISDTPESEWMKALSNAGLSAVMVKESDLSDGAIMKNIKTAGLIPVQQGGLARGGLYFFAARYDTLADRNEFGMNVDEEPLPSDALMRSISDSGSTLVLVENAAQTGAVAPVGVEIPDDITPALKCFWLNQTFRARYSTLGYNGSEEIENMFFRAVIDRGINVLWLTPMVHDETIVSDMSSYTDLLTNLRARIQPLGYDLDIPNGYEALAVSQFVLLLCGIGITSAAVYLLSMLLERKRGWILWLLFALGSLECILVSWLSPALQVSFLALASAIIFPSIAITIYARRLLQSAETASCSISYYLQTAVLCVAIVLLGCLYIGGILGSSDYILVLRVFRGVKLSQLSVYLFGMVMTEYSLMHTRRNLCSDLRNTAAHFNKKLIAQLLAVVGIMVGIGAIFIMRSGDGMLSVTILEQRARNWLESVLFFRPRTKEFLIAWPAMALSFCFAARKNRLFAWLFGALGTIGFASVANTFCHIRAHFLVSVARTMIGLLIGLAFGTLLYYLFRPAKE